MSPKRVERLEKTLALVAREQELDQERLRRWVSFLALCGVLERAVTEGVLDGYCLKGGVAMEIRFANRCSICFALFRKPRAATGSSSGTAKRN